MNEYAVCDMIYHLSNNPKYNWCIMSKENMAEEIWLSKQSIHSILEKMIEKKFIEKDSQTRFLKTTDLWYTEFVFTDSKETWLQGVKKVYSDSKESLHYNNRDNNIYNNNKKRIQ